MRILSLLSSGVAVTALLTGVSLAQETQSFDNIERVEIMNFIGAVTINTGGDKVSVRKSDGTDASYPFHMESGEGELVLRSDEDPDDTRWHDDVNWRRHGEKAFDKFLETYPSLEITVPRGTALAFDSAVVRLAADDTNGGLKVREGYVDGEIGNIATGDIGIHGSGDLIVGDVAGELTIKIHGSGDFNAGDAGSLNASIHGSGDIEAGDVASAVNASIHGSGDILLGDIDGPVSLSVHGSGDVDTAHVNGGAELSIMGSGDLTLASVSGETSVSINGGGDIDIAGGRAENLRVRINGSGDFRLAGSASSPNIAVNGSGSAYIVNHDGPVRVSGRGDIIISGVNYTDDD